MRLRFVYIFVILFLALPLTLAAHFITGVVDNARDGTAANDRIVVLWNPANGVDDNLTDIIGPNGNSGADNVYLIDCELLNMACNVGDELRIRVINETNKYTTYQQNLNVTGFGFDIANNLTLNSPPNSTLISPINNANLSSEQVQFNCSYDDLDSNINNITLYGNWSGGWHANETISVSGGSSVIFSKNISEGTYEWNCLAYDNLSFSSFDDFNYSFTIDTTSPDITSVLFNETYICGTNYLRVNCTVTDNAGIDSVIIEALRPNGVTNHSTSLLLGDTYYADILINSTGDWRFNCIVNDTSGNIANLTSDKLSSYPNSPEIRVYSSDIHFSDNSPIENEAIILNATVQNLACTPAENVLIGFYNGDPDSTGIQIDINQTITISSLSNSTVNVTWNAQIGTNNIFVDSDINDTYTEFNESNNKANKTMLVGSWQNFYGNVSVDKLLSDAFFFNISLWNNQTNLTGGIFIADTESSINWLSLKAIGVNISNDTTINDFDDIDSLLNMADFNDSVSNTFNTVSYQNFLINQKIINNVSVINSTNNSDFVTGILWDYSDDVGDGEFSQEDKEDLVFAAKINKAKQGAYGIYDYELRVPARLREYNQTESSNIYLYYELV